MSEAQVGKVIDALGSVVGCAGMAPLPAPAPAPTSPPRSLVQGYGQSVHLFLAAVAQGMSTNASFQRTRSWARWQTASVCCTEQNVRSSVAVRVKRI